MKLSISEVILFSRLFNVSVIYYICRIFNKFELITLLYYFVARFKVLTLFLIMKNIYIIFFSRNERSAQAKTCAVL